MNERGFDCPLHYMLQLETDDPVIYRERIDYAMRKISCKCIRQLLGAIVVNAPIGNRDWSDYKTQLGQLFASPDNIGDGRNNTMFGPVYFGPARNLRLTT